MGGLTVRVPCAMEALQIELQNYSQTGNVINLEWHATGSPGRRMLSPY